MHSSLHTHLSRRWIEYSSEKMRKKAVQRKKNQINYYYLAKHVDCMCVCVCVWLEVSPWGNHSVSHGYQRLNKDWLLFRNGNNAKTPFSFSLHGSFSLLSDSSNFFTLNFFSFQVIRVFSPCNIFCLSWFFLEKFANRFW